MKKYLTQRNLGWALTVPLAGLLIMSAVGKLMGSQEVLDMLGSNNLQEWTTIIGVGELASVILFLIPKTMRLGTLLLSAYFGGAIVFHMANPDPAHQSFVGPSVFLVGIWVISWIRGLDLFDMKRA